MLKTKQTFGKSLNILCLFSWWFKKIGVTRDGLRNIRDRNWENYLLVCLAPVREVSKMSKRMK